MEYVYDDKEILKFELPMKKIISEMTDSFAKILYQELNSID